MTNVLYTRTQLESKKLSELRAIALELSAAATDKRSKESWIAAILLAQPQPVKSLEEVKPVATCTDCPKFQPHNDGTDKGWCCLFDRFARDRHAMTQDCINTIEDEQVDDYLFHEEVQQPVNLPRVGETHFISDRLLRCIQVGGEYAAVWDVIDNGVTMGEIKMGWDCFWHHTMSLTAFATPQEAVADLQISLEAYKQEIQQECSVSIKKGDKVYTFQSIALEKQVLANLSLNFSISEINAAIITSLPQKVAAQIEREHEKAWDRY